MTKNPSGKPVRDDDGDGERDACSRLFDADSFEDGWRATFVPLRRRVWARVRTANRLAASRGVKGDDERARPPAATTATTAAAARRYHTTLCCARKFLPRNAETSFFSKGKQNRVVHTILRFDRAEGYRPPNGTRFQQVLVGVDRNGQKQTTFSKRISATANRRRNERNIRRIAANNIENTCSIV